MKSLIIAAVLACAPAAALAADESGTWNVSGAFGEAIKYTSVCTLKQDDAGKLTGSCKGTQNEDAAATGAVTGTSVEFAYDTTYQGSPVHLDYKGDLQSDGSLKGTVDTGGAQGTFTATK
ncbi:MAG TPA: hypothetical protein VMT68_04675 [Caulobacteraceae bacterium]|nr:hypothetical protein [Caulobacteraceae bacterium]